MVKKSKKSGVGPYPFEFRLRVVKLYFEEEYSTSMLAEEFGCSKSAVNYWVRKYRENGEGGLRTTLRPQGSTKLNTSVKCQIEDLKRKNPSYGIRRISDTLKRFFFLKASPETVRKTLHEADLMESSKVSKKRQKNITKPRFFERSTPNQLWQTDICTFRLAGKNAYLLGFIDDYSRYIVGMGLYRSQTASNLLEVYRTALGEYGVPKEMLTDNGRQYTNWRGTTNFEKELKKDRVKHIKSRPHHPMTLGKIERFWKTILSEFLYRVQFDSFENARERLALWIKYYNYKRPHQGIGGLCPADRYFEVKNELRNTLEKGVAENSLELALRGKPQSPFYMVGRMGDQNVVIRAEKGKVKMHVDKGEDDLGEELVYDLKQENNNEAQNAENTGNGIGGIRGNSQNTRGEEFEADTFGENQVSCSAVDLDGESDSERDMPSVECDPCAGESLAGDSDGVDDLELGLEWAQGEDSGTEQQAGEAPGETCAEADVEAQEARWKTDEDTGFFAEEVNKKEYYEQEEPYSRKVRELEENTGPQTRRGYSESPRRPLHRKRRRLRA